LRDIKNLDCSEAYHGLNFEPMVHDIKIGSGATRQDPAYEVTKDGFIFLVMGYTGKKAAQIKEKWIQAFNKMETAILIQMIEYNDLKRQLEDEQERNSRLEKKILESIPYWKEIKHYKRLELSNNEIVRLIGKESSFISSELKEMRDLGIEPASIYSNLALFKVLHNHDSHLVKAYRSHFPGHYNKMYEYARSNKKTAEDQT